MSSPTMASSSKSGDPRSLQGISEENLNTEESCIYSAKNGNQANKILSSLQLVVQLDVPNGPLTDFPEGIRSCVACRELPKQQSISNAQLLLDNRKNAFADAQHLANVTQSIVSVAPSQKVQVDTSAAIDQIPKSESHVNEPKVSLASSIVSLRPTTEETRGAVKDEKRWEGCESLDSGRKEDDVSEVDMTDIEDEEEIEEESADLSDDKETKAESNIAKTEDIANKVPIEFSTPIKTDKKTEDVVSALKKEEIKSLCTSSKSINNYSTNKSMNDPAAANVFQSHAGKSIKEPNSTDPDIVKKEDIAKTVTFQFSAPIKPDKKRENVVPAWKEEGFWSPCSPSESISNYSTNKMNDPAIANVFQSCAGENIEESNSSDTPRFITTRTGRFFHCDPKCENLKSATKLFRTNEPDENLHPCYICASEYEGDKHPCFKTNQTNNEKCGNYDSTLRFITTRTGRYFHCDPECDNLRSAKKLFRTSKPNESLLACYICAKQYESMSNSQSGTPSLSTRNHPSTLENAKVVQQSSLRKSDDEIESGKNGKGPFITTRTGRFFHMDENCHNLRSARKLIFVNAVAMDLDPCYLCVNESVDVPRNASPLFGSITDSHSKSSTTYGMTPSTTAKSSQSRRLRSSRTYYTTRTGRFYHADQQCYNLRSAKKTFPVDHIPTNLKPCYLCI